MSAAGILSLHLDVGSDLDGVHIPPLNLSTLQRIWVDFPFTELADANIYSENNKISADSCKCMRVIWFGLDLGMFWAVQISHVRRWRIRFCSYIRLEDFCSGFNLGGLKGMQHELNRRT